MLSVIRLIPFILVALIPLWGQVLPGRYILELSEEPVVRGKSRLAAVRSSQDLTRRALASRRISVMHAVENVASALIVEAPSQAGLAELPGVRQVHPVRLYKQLLDRAVLLQHVTEGWTIAGGMENAGRGVRIGIIDRGIDITHPGFQDPTMTAPEGFPKFVNSVDAENTNGKVIVARSYSRRSSESARDTNGHGTGVAMVAAGGTTTGPMGVITGIAPKAWLGNYKVFADDSTFASTDAILRAIDDAVADGMDVINLSLGSFPAQNPDNDILVRALDRASAAGVIVVVAAGNEGALPATIGSPATAASAIAVGNAYTDRIFASTIQLEGQAPYLAIPSSTSGGNAPLSGLLSDVAEFDPSGLACSELPAGRLDGKIAFILRGTCFFEDKLRNAQAAGAIAAIVYTHADSPQASIMETGSSHLPAVMISNRDGLDLKGRIQQGGGTTSARVHFMPAAVGVISSRLGPSSSRGPSVDYNIKPEMLGVGTSVYTAAASSSTGEIRYQASTGTSFSAPMIAGAAAVLKSARPGLTTQQYRSLLINSSGTFSYDHAVPAPIQHTGSGLLNLFAALKSTITAAPQTINFRSGTADVSQTVPITLANLGAADDTYSLSVDPLNSGLAPVLSDSQLTVPAGGSREIRVSLEGTGLASGQYQGFVTVRSTSSDSVARIPYWYGVPSTEVDQILVVEPPESASRSSLQELQIRPSDAAGFPVDTSVTVSVIQGGGSVGQVRPDRVFPGFQIAEVTVGPQPGTNIFEVHAGGKTLRVIIDVE